MENKAKYLGESYFFNFQHPKIQQFLEVEGLFDLSQRQQSKVLFNLVRDRWRYNPNRVSFSQADWQASAILDQPTAHCLDKAILMISFLRALGIPARLRLAQVRNHLAVTHIIKQYGHDILTPHGYLEAFINQHWIKLTPTFNTELCRYLGVAPVDFDGEHEAILQEYDANKGLFMEYLKDYGHFEDLPLDFIYQNMIQYYPGLEDYYHKGTTWEFQKM